MMIRSELVRQFGCLPDFKQRKTNLTGGVNFTLLLIDHESERGILKYLFNFRSI